MIQRGLVISISMAVVTAIFVLPLRDRNLLYQRDTHIPKAGFVPDAPTAVSIAEAVIAPIYGDKVIQSERPFVAELSEAGEVWIVHGHPPPQADRAGWHGGVAVVEISKASGCILRVNHPK